MKNSFLRNVTTTLIVALLASTLGIAQTSHVSAQEPLDYHWSPVPSASANNSNCFFRKRFTLANPEDGQVLIAATGDYTLHVNGRRVISGGPDSSFQTVSIAKFLNPGVNLVAVEVRSQDLPNQDGAAFRLRIKEKGEVRWRAVALDSSWLTHRSRIEGWERNAFRELSWLPAQKVSLLPVDSTVAQTTPTQNTLASGTVTSVSSSTTPIPSAPQDKVTPIAPTSVLERTEPDVENPKSRGLLGIVAAKLGPKDADATPVEVVVPPGPTSEITSNALTPIPVNKVSSADSAQSIPSSNHPLTPRLNYSVSAKSEGSSSGPTDDNRSSPPTQQTITLPAGNTSASSSSEPGPEVISAQPTFQISDEFDIAAVMTGEETGSIIAMTFDEFGYLIFSREGSHLFIADLNIEYGKTRVATLCEEVENCQGLLCVNGKLYVTGDGPEGLGLYCLERVSPQSTTMKVAQTLVKFSGLPSEHGPHGLTLGPDGKIYCIVGNASGIEGNTQNGPYRFPYETDMTPRYEDPSGHANGIKAPGGTIVRLNLDGSQIQTVAGGIRNAYDLAFNADGELFVHDSDMESDLGLPWYRPTALYHVVDGADLGWRSGWAKFPEYYADTIPSVAKTGRGSPTGAICYEHLQFPLRYHGSMFLADWSEGRIIAVRMERNGATYITETEDFLKGKPLNITDLEIGEDGAMYFATGGRGTSGGIYRISWKGAVPDSIVKFEDELTKLLRHPQPSAAWSRQNMALLVTENPIDWTKELQLVARETENSDTIRIKALDYLYLFGLIDNTTILQELSTDKSDRVRAKVAELCGKTTDTQPLAVKFLSDSSPFVQLKAAESLLNNKTPAPVDIAIKIASHESPVLASVGCRLLEQLPETSWKSNILTSDNSREFLMGSIALLRAYPTLENSYAVLARCSTMLDGFVNDRDFMDLLRVTQLALTRANIDPNQISGFTSKITPEFPTQNPMLNRELIRILAYLRATDAQPEWIKYLATHDDDAETKTLVAMYLATLAEHLNDETRLAVIDYLSSSIAKNGGGSYQHYLTRCIGQLTNQLSDSAVSQVIKRGAEWPHALVVAFYRLDKPAMVALAPTLCELDQQLAPLAKQDVMAQARLGIIALLAEGNTDIGSQYLRDCWMKDPQRRGDLIIGIAHNPTQENWTYLVASIPLLDDLTGQEVLTAIQSVKLRPTDPKYYRDVLELGYRLGKNGGDQAAQVLKLWTQENLIPKSNGWEGQLDAWSDWFRARWPDQTPVSKPDPKQNPQLMHLTKFQKAIDSEFMAGNAENGRLVFTKAECAKCHRFGTTGDSSGPDLTTLSGRFSKRETLESIVDPSKNVSDQYRSTLVVNDQGVTFTGLKVENGDGSISLIQPDASRIRLAKSEIAESREILTSPMPAGLLDKLSQQEVADLFAFLYPESTGRQATTPSTVK